MAFSVENPGFALDVSDQVDVHQSESSVLQLSGSPSTPSYGESTCRSCQSCHGRMSSFSLDRHTFCINVVDLITGLTISVMSVCHGSVRR